MKKLPVSLYLLLLLLLSGSNFALRYFDLPNYFFLIGFRFYGIIFISGIFLLLFHEVGTLKNYLLPFSFVKFYKYLFLVAIPAIVIVGVLFILRKIDLGDPDYFYELGLTSIVDYPLYLIWNFPQFLILYALLQMVELSFKMKIIPNFILLFFFFSAEFFALPKINFDIFPVISYLVVLLAITLFIYKKPTNVLAFSFYFFTIIWLGLLLFGSHSQTLLQIFLAKTYTGWDGFFEINKKMLPFVFPVYFLLSGLLVLFFKKEKPKD